MAWVKKTQCQNNMWLYKAQITKQFGFIKKCFRKNDNFEKIAPKTYG